MTQEIINVGTVANDGTGDTLRVSFIKTNNNTTELYNNQANTVSDLANLVVNTSATQAMIFNHSNLVFSRLNVSWAKTNSVYTFANSIYDFSNLVFNFSNSIYDYANTVNTFAYGVNQNTTAAFAFANSVNVYSYSSYQHANQAFSTSNLVFNIANLGFDLANSVNTSLTTLVVASGYAIANLAYNTANNAYNTTNNAYNTANNAYNTTNNAYNTANIGYTVANNAYNTANIGYTVANNAYNTANVVTTRFNNSFPFRNRFINGDMRIAQYYGDGNRVLNIVVSGVRSVDGWAYVYSGDNHFNINSPNTSTGLTPSFGAPVGFDHKLRCRVFNRQSPVSGYYANGFVAIAQPLEGLNMTDLNWGTSNASNAMLSFWVCSTNTGLFGGAVTSSTKDVSYPFSYAVNSANTWEYKTISIPGPTTGTFFSNSNTGMTVRLDLGSSNTFAITTPNTWTSGNFYRPNNTISLLNYIDNVVEWTGIQLEAGDVATSFERRPYQVELQLCQRYIEKSWNANLGYFGSPSFQGSYAGAAYFTAKDSTTFYGGGFISFKTRKRAAPILRGFAPSDQSISLFYNVTSANTTGDITFTEQGETGTRVYNGTSNSSLYFIANRDYSLHWVAESLLPL
jgi:hypothetical protein